MSRRNMIWLGAVVVVGAVIGVTAGWVWGIVAAGAVLVFSEIVERARRQRLRSERGAEGVPSVRDAITHRRRR